MSASTGRARDGRSVRAGLVSAVLLAVVVGLVPAGAARAGAAVDPDTADSASPGHVVTAWGQTSYGQSRVPAGLHGVTAVATGGDHSLALRSDGTVVTWGANWDDYGQTRMPAGLRGVTAVAAGGYHSLALHADGTLAAWGNSRSGQTWVPAGLSGVTAIAAGASHNLALRGDGTVVAWGGYGWYGRLTCRRTCAESPRSPAAGGTAWRCARMAPWSPGAMTFSGRSGCRWG